MDIQKKIAEVKNYNLTFLELRNHKLTQIPEEVFKLTSLEFLDLSQNKINNISSSIGNLTNLRVLKVSQNILSDLPESLSNLTNITELYIHSNKFQHLPPSIYYLSNLEVFHFQNNKIKRIDSKIYMLKNLKTLYGGENKLESIPTEIRKLNKLEILYLASNNIKNIPSEIGELPSLQDLNLYSNKIKRMPSDIGNLTKLTNISIDFNPLENPPIEIIKRGSGAIINYFRELVSGEQDYLYEAKLLIIGEGGAGKTTLHEKIQNINYDLNKNEKSTEGIEIRPYFFNMQGKSYRVNVWDFGGQEIYHSTHQFFLTKRSLYALVADTRKEDTDFNYWLNVVELLSDNSPILIVQNEKQDRRKDINVRAIRERFDNFKGLYRTNLMTNRGLENFIEYVKFEISTLPHIGTALPLTWINIRKELEEHNSNFIYLNEYLNICKKNGVNERNKALYLSEYLHDLGIFLHFQDNRVLLNIIILNTEWGTDAVYKLLDDKNVLEHYGRFEYEDLPKIWSNSDYDNMYNELLELMIKFEICYPLPDSSTFIAPQLLPVNKPDYKWDERRNMIIRYKYDFMPKGLVTRLIVRLHKFIFDQSLVWKEGALLKKGSCHAEITQVYDSDEIRIRVRGDKRENFNIIITEELEKIHGLFPRLKVTKFVPCVCSSCSTFTTPHFYTYEQLAIRKNRNKETIECEISYELVNVEDLLTSISGKSEDATEGEIYTLQEILISKIENNKLGEAITLLLEHFKQQDDKHGLQQIVIISSNYRRVNDQVSHGLLSTEKERREISLITKSLFNLTSLIDS